MKPLAFKVGAAVSLSVTGYLCYHLGYRAYRRRRSRCRPHHPPSVVACECAGADGGGKARGGLKDELLRLQSGDASSSLGYGTGAKMVASAQEERFLAEFDALMLQGFGDGETDMVALDAPLTKRPPEKKNGDTAAIEEVAVLKSLVRSLRERERRMEIRMLEYYDLKEQEAAAAELESRLRISDMEAELLSMKIESLQAENRSLRAQASEYPGTKAELDDARAKIKSLKRKRKAESAQSKEKIASLHKAVGGLECRLGEQEAAAEKGTKKLIRLEDEAAELSRANSTLKTDNLGLTRELEAASLRAAADQATEKLGDELNRLRKEKGEMAVRMEQLQADRYSDVEELVYLRWINACLRYELRDYRPPPGTKAAARDLSRTLSPRSEHRVKRLILQYASTVGADEGGVDAADFDTEWCSPPRASSSAEAPADDAASEAPPVPKSGAGGGKKKLFARLKKLVLGKVDLRCRGFPSPEASPTSCGTAGEMITSASSCSLEGPTERSSSQSSVASCQHVDAAGGGGADDRRQTGSRWARELSVADFRWPTRHEGAGDGDHGKNHQARPGEHTGKLKPRKHVRRGGSGKPGRLVSDSFRLP